MINSRIIEEYKKDEKRLKKEGDGNKIFLIMRANIEFSVLLRRFFRRLR
jgi:hypothetical protein